MSADRARGDDPQAILAWWQAAGRERWFGGGADFDAAVRARLLPVHEAAAAGTLRHWEVTPDGALALVILLDQVPRNVFRGTPRAFASDAQALAVAERALARDFDRGPELPLRTFFYLPFMHAEDGRQQQRCVELYRASGDEEGLRFALVHQEAIARFGRFPHRNPILGRVMRPEEQAYLDAGGFTG